MTFYEPNNLKSLRMPLTTKNYLYINSGRSPVRSCPKPKRNFKAFDPTIFQTQNSLFFDNKSDENATENFSSTELKKQPEKSCYKIMSCSGIITDTNKLNIKKLQNIVALDQSKFENKKMGNSNHHFYKKHDKNIDQEQKLNGFDQNNYYFTRNNNVEQPNLTKLKKKFNFSFFNNDDSLQELKPKINLSKNYEKRNKTEVSEDQYKFPGSSKKFSSKNLIAVNNIVLQEKSTTQTPFPVTPRKLDKTFPKINFVKNLLDNELKKQSDDEKQKYDEDRKSIIEKLMLSEKNLQAADNGNIIKNRIESINEDRASINSLKAIFGKDVEEDKNFVIENKNQKSKITIKMYDKIKQINKNDFTDPNSLKQITKNNASLMSRQTKKLPKPFSTERKSETRNRTDSFKHKLERSESDSNMMSMNLEIIDGSQISASINNFDVPSEHPLNKFSMGNKKRISKGISESYTVEDSKCHFNKIYDDIGTTQKTSDNIKKEINIKYLYLKIDGKYQKTDEDSINLFEILQNIYEQFQLCQSVMKNVNFLLKTIQERFRKANIVKLLFTKNGSPKKTNPVLMDKIYGIQGKQGLDDKELSYVDLEQILSKIDKQKSNIDNKLIHQNTNKTNSCPVLKVSMFTIKELYEFYDYLKTTHNEIATKKHHTIQNMLIKRTQDVQVTSKEVIRFFNHKGPFNAMRFNEKMKDAMTPKITWSEALKPNSVRVMDKEMPFIDPRLMSLNKNMNDMLHRTQILFKPKSTTTRNHQADSYRL